MKLLVVISALLTVSLAQRPSFAGTSPIGVPKLAPRFQNGSGDSSSTTQADVVNRFGDGSDSQASTPRIPTDARGDVALVNRLNTWPRENRPFWLINADHIEKNRYPNGGGPTDRVSSTQNSQGAVEATSGRIPVDARFGQQEPGHAQVVPNRSSFGQDRQPVQNSFTVISDNKLKTYVYDPVSDSWKAVSS